ncbi:MAG: hypothetical protein IPO57_11160 [Rhodocyclales bacterium]|jgi:hypothetical protein|nr:hypothetical protein [Rhodocyclales bacterium]
MSSLINGFGGDGTVTINRVVLRPEFTVDDLEMRVAEMCENGNEEIAYRMLWSGRAYTSEEAIEARAAKERYFKAA